MTHNVVVTSENTVSREVTEEEKSIIEEMHQHVSEVIRHQVELQSQITTLQHDSQTYSSHTESNNVQIEHLTQEVHECQETVVSMK
eukprot:TRINITY_DN40717_c0_g1_i1.p1 TRINITY_DN40717_c0_g1~~TRINITY_DN40717_c0_g1_i1.p1  ORF type:complete len:101 (-),score=13.92 TRINITY_DN40717_c0_g1_i1:11-268(-)